VQKIDFDKYKLDAKVRITVFALGLLAAVTLAILHSNYTGEAFALVSGLIGGSALPGKPA